MTYEQAVIKIAKALDAAGEMDTAAETLDEFLINSGRFVCVDDIDQAAERGSLDISEQFVSQVIDETADFCGWSKQQRYEAEKATEEETA